MPVLKSLTSGKCHFWYHVDPEGPYEEAGGMDVYNLTYCLHKYSWTIHPSQHLRLRIISQASVCYLVLCELESFPVRNL